MNKNQKEKISQQIEIEIKKTQDLVVEYKNLVKPIAPDCAIGRVSRMDSIISQNIPKEALRKAEKRLKNLEYAQKNIENEGFGICARCGNDIPIGRILLVPHSKFCVNCAN